MRQPYVAGNWKMNGSRESVKSLVEGIKAEAAGLSKTQVAMCSPYVYLADVQDMLQGSKLQWGAQNVSEHASGAYTGEIAVSMIKDFGCQVIIVGHSERRALYGESDDLVAQKFAVTRAAGMTPILCVGETLEEREKGVTEEVVARQLDAVIKLEGIEALADSIIAYEPVWAIGTGMTATPQQAQDVHAFIRGRIAQDNADVAAKVQILYGGSVKPDNAEELFGMADIDGGLIGGASLQVSDFMAICKAADN